MSTELYSAEQVAEMLGLHVRTVRSYLRDGKLKAVRIGKQYRIAAHDLREFTGGGQLDPTVSRRTHHVEVSSIVEIDAVDPDLASRVATGLTGAAHGRDKAGIENPVRVQVIYYPERARLKMILTGGIGPITQLLGLVELLLEAQR